MRPIHIAATGRALKTRSTHRIHTHMLKHFSCSPHPHGVSISLSFLCHNSFVINSKSHYGISTKQVLRKRLLVQGYPQTKLFGPISNNTDVNFRTLFQVVFVRLGRKHTTKKKKKKRWVKNAKMTKKWLNFILRPQTFRNSKVPPWKYNRSLRIWHREFVLQ